jgi:dihydrodipicolinate synthase/N-acetylneuraminate lyase
VKQFISPKFWSATPTPLDAQLRVDVSSVKRTIHTAIAEGIDGFFVGGTCGEGPWLPNRERKRLLHAVVDAAEGRVPIAAQVSDNSVPRILDNIHDMAGAGANYVLIASPAMMMNATPERICALFEEAVSRSPLPVGIYDWGTARPFPIPENRLKEMYLMPNVALVKDSSATPERRSLALAAKREKPSLTLFNGNEFRCVEYIEAGYDACMFGGASVIAPLLMEIRELLRGGRAEQARKVEQSMRDILFGVYGGESIACWLTGLKYYMTKRGLFDTIHSYLGYPLHEECRAFIDRHIQDTAQLQQAK